MLLFQKQIALIMSSGYCNSCFDTHFFTTFHYYYRLKIILEREKESLDLTVKILWYSNLLSVLHMPVNRSCFLSFFFLTAEEIKSLAQGIWKSTCICIATCVLHSRCTGTESASNSQVRQTV